MKRTLVFVTASLLLLASAAQATHTPAPILHRSALSIAARARLTLAPRVVAAGGRLTFIGRGFRPNQKVWLGVGPPQSEAVRWGTTRATRAGAFRRTFTVNRHVKPGRWVAIACQQGCRIKAGASFRTVLGRG